MSTEPGKLIGTKMSFQMNHASICGTMMGTFMLDAMPVNIPEWVIKRHRGIISRVVVWDVISYHGRSNLLRIEGNFNRSRYVREVLQHEVVLFLQDNPGVIFQQDNACPHVAKTVQDFCSAQHMQLLPWPAYSPDMSPIEHVGNLVGQRFARDQRPAASKEELLLRIQAICLPKADIQNL
ncbi:transposable element Tcb2 transposase [Trichonephila clavipes]|nr:transposable element Tcb2 transposase [Trichonephila clavipes]